MPTVHREANRRYVIFTNDHPPPHLHVKAPGCECRIHIEDARVMSNAGFTQRDLRVIIATVIENASAFRLAWDGIFSEN
jgi:hypothetical protein